MSGIRWSPADDARLKTLYAAGVSAEDIAAQLSKGGTKRTAESVGHRAFNLGFRRRCEAISTELILRLAEKGVRAGDIPGATLSQAGNKLTRMTKAGKLYRASVSHKHAAFFTTLAAAQAYQAMHHKAPSMVIKNRAPWPADAPMVLTPATKYTIAPKPPERLYKTGTFNLYS